MAVKTMRFKNELKIGVIAVLALLSGASAFADESAGNGSLGFFASLVQGFSSLFRSSEVAHVEERVIPASSPSPVSQESDGQLDLTQYVETGSGQSSSRDPQSQTQAQAQTQTQTQTQDTAKAQDAAQNKFSAPVTRDSSVSIPGTIPGGAHWMMISIQKAGEASSVIDAISVRENSPIPTIYLHQGAGDYKVLLFASQSEKRTDNVYKYFATASVRNEDARDGAFLLPSLNIQSDDPEIVALSAKITRGRVTDREKALAIHDWITREMNYDDDGVRTNEFLTRPQDAKAVLQSRLAVCDGFSNLFAALSRAAGLQTKVITGPLGVPNSRLSKEEVCDPERSNAVLHAWNEVYLDHRWVQVDATVDTGSSHTELRSDGPDRTYFKRTPNNHALFDPASWIFERDHTKCDEAIR